MDKKHINLILGACVYLGYARLRHKQNQLANNLNLLFDVVKAWMEADYQQDIDEAFYELVERFND